VSCFSLWGLTRLPADEPARFSTPQLASLLAC
jgi:hypothetical protein